MKHESFDEETQSRSSASSHDAGNAADTEMEMGPGAENTRQAGEKRGDGAPPPQPQPAKKKRTRTLTTPHQSAVLHALLAQSRFPTTAMREEVGRSIGLSARKVQVWFQNQRQKARRPRNQGSPPPTRLSQYGAYPDAPAPTLAASIVGPSIVPTHDEQAPFRTAPSVPFVQFNMNREHSSHEDVVGASVTGTGSSSGSSSRLSGPGVPGVSTSFAPRFPSTLPPMTAPSSSISGHHDSTHRRPPTSNGHGNVARHSAPPSRDFTFNFPFPPLQVPHATQNWFPPPHHHRMTASPPHLSMGEKQLQPQPQQQRPQQQQQHQQQQQMFFAAAPSSRPHTPRSSSVVPPPHSRLESARDLPRLRIPPLHVPESPHAAVRQRSSWSYSPSQDPVRAVLSTTTTTTTTNSGSSRGGSPSAPRARRFDPVREAASERSASQGTDSSTPPRIDTPHV